MGGMTHGLLKRFWGTKRSFRTNKKNQEKYELIMKEMLNFRQFQIDSEKLYSYLQKDGWISDRIERCKSGNSWIEGHPMSESRIKEPEDRPEWNSSDLHATAWWLGYLLSFSSINCCYWCLWGFRVTAPLHLSGNCSGNVELDSLWIRMTKRQSLFSTRLDRLSY